MTRILLLLLVLFSTNLFAQKKKQEPSLASSTPTPSAIEGKVSGMKKYPGFFDFYYDEKQDKIFLVIDKWDAEFIYVESVTAGVGSNDIGIDRNQLGGERIVKFERKGPKVLMTQPNYFYRAISTNAAERKA
ncbi:MAG: peptidase, partial [Cyclobacteriaceae bacterium]